MEPGQDLNQNGGERKGRSKGGTESQETTCPENNCPQLWKRLAGEDAHGRTHWPTVKGKGKKSSETRINKYPQKRGKIQLGVPGTIISGAPKT